MKIFVYNCIFAADEAILLGFQHYIVMLGTTVIIPTALVPQMGGGNVRLTLVSNFSLNPCKYIPFHTFMLRLFHTL